MTTGTTVGTTTNTDGFRGNLGPFYIQGRYWLFWVDGTNFVWSHSTDLSSWAAKQTAIASLNDVWKESVSCDGTYFHIAYVGASSHIYYVRGTPASDGSIAFGTARDTGGIGTYPDVCASGSHVYITYLSAAQKPTVIRNDDATSVDTWTTTTGFPVLISNTATSECSRILPKSDGGVFTIYAVSNHIKLKTCATDATLGGEESCSLSFDSSSMFDVTGGGIAGVIAFAYRDANSGNMLYRERSSGGTWDVAETTIVAASSSTRPALFYDATSGTVVLFCVGTSTANHVYYNERLSGTWGGMLKAVYEGSLIDPLKDDGFWLNRWYRDSKGV